MDLRYKNIGIYVAKETLFNIDDTLNFYYKNTIYGILFDSKSLKSIRFKHLYDFINQMACEKIKNKISCHFKKDLK